MSITINANDSLARSFEDAALAFARFGVAMTTHHWRRDLHAQAKATLARVESDVIRARRYRANKPASTDYH